MGMLNYRGKGIIGIMSGTSLDGMDLAYCRFTEQNGKWTYQIDHAEIFPYDTAWRNRFLYAQALKGRELLRMEVEFSRLTADCVNDFCQRNNLKPSLIAAHGHTIFHEPANGLTWQMLDGALVAEQTAVPVVCNFRKGDVALGGQGAPLVPIGDELLFSEFDYCLNLGGIANITLKQASKRIAYDIVPNNMGYNEAIRRLGKEYDEDGNTARTGKVHHELLRALNSMDFYKQSYPKSIGREYYVETFKPLVQRWSLSVADELATLVEHAAMQIAKAVEGGEPGRKMLATGGGAFNTYLIERIRHHLQCELIIPDEKIVAYKEALIFAFLGLLRMERQTNIRKEITGASRNSCAGAVYQSVTDNE